MVKKKGFQFEAFARNNILKIIDYILINIEDLINDLVQNFLVLRKKSN